MEELKKNNEIKGVQRYEAEHLIPVLITVEDETLDKVVGLLDIKYGRSCTEKVKNVIGYYSKVKEENYEDDDELILTMKELTQRRVELGMSFEEFDTVWRLEKIRKRSRIEGFEMNSLQNVVKEGGPNVVTNFDNKLKEIRIEGKRKDYNSSSYVEKLPDTHYTEAEQKEIETLYMGRESLLRQRFQRSRSRSLQR